MRIIIEETIIEYDLTKGGKYLGVSNRLINGYKSKEDCSKYLRVWYGGYDFQTDIRFIQHKETVLSISQDEIKDMFPDHVYSTRLLPMTD